MLIANELRGAIKARIGRRTAFKYYETLQVFQMQLTNDKILVGELSAKKEQNK